MLFIEGFGFGLAMVLLIGPVFFTLLKAALTHGTRGGIAVATGIIISDIVVVVICMTGLHTFLDIDLNNEWLAVAAGLILLTLGLKYILKPTIASEDDNSISTKGMAGLAGSGFLVNFVNPFVFVVWISMSIHAGKQYDANSSQWIFMFGALAGIFTTDLLKAILAERLRRFMAPTVLKRIFKGIGIILIAFSIRAFIHAFTS